MTYRSHLLTRQALKILLNKKITGFKPLKPKLHWDLTLNMVFRCNILYFVALIMFMDGLFLDNGFRTWFSYFIISIAVVVVSLVFLFLVLSFYYYFIILFYYYYYYHYYIFIKFVLIFCGYGYFFVKLLGSPIIYVRDICLLVYVTFNIRKFSMAFFIALPWILLSYLLIVLSYKISL